jgi:hypothetical protein
MSCVALKLTTALAANDAFSFGWQKCCVASKAYSVQLAAAAKPVVRYASNEVSSLSGARRYSVVFHKTVALAMLQDALAAVCRVIAALLPMSTWWLL